ncbi:MAG TPA: hypothetical protein VMZ26_14050 [Pyrinomonadaceae bacterium]|nr:hypothetical protein [Pyrinomonadaceae bacterium]
MKKIIALSTLLAFGALGMACGGDAANNSTANANSNKSANAALSNANAALANANSQIQTAANQISNAASQTNSTSSNAMANKPANATVVSNANANNSNHK